MGIRIKMMDEEKIIDAGEWKLKDTFTFASKDLDENKTSSIVMIHRDDFEKIINDECIEFLYKAFINKAAIFLNYEEIKKIHNNQQTTKPEPAGDIEKIDVEHLQNYLNDAELDSEIHIYINDTPIGFPIHEVSFDFDGSIKIHIQDPTIQVTDE